MLRIVIYFLLLSSTIILFSCEDSAGPEPNPQSRIDSVVVTPNSATVEPQGHVQFTYNVYGTGNFDPSVNWFVNYGLVSASGFYTAPSFETTDTVRAVSVQDYGKYAAAVVVVKSLPPPKIDSVVVMPDTITLEFNSSFQFSAQVFGTGNFDPSVNWSALYGSVDNGFYTTPNFAVVDTLKAISVANPEKFGIALINVVEPPPPLKPWLVFTRSHWIYVMYSDSSVVKLSDTPYQDDFPSWSSDGTKIAFYSNRTTKWHLFLMDLDGSNQTDITPNNMKNILWPSWSPDGNYIVFTGEDKSKETWDVYKLELSTGETTQLTEEGLAGGHIAGYAKYSPDGTKIVFNSHRDGNDEIYVMNADGSNETRITNNFSSDLAPNWLPDERIVFNSNRNGRWHIFVMNSDGSGVIKITPDDGLDHVYPDCSPDGTKIAMVVADGQQPGTPPDIYTINTDGTEMTNITNSPDFEDTPDWYPLY